RLERGDAPRRRGTRGVPAGRGEPPDARSDPTLRGTRAPLVRRLRGSGDRLRLVLSVRMSSSILCVTPNPAVDRTLEVPHLRTGTTMRATSARAAAGGKGVNVARALSTLGARALCMGPLGGANGRIVADLAAAEGLAGKWTWCGTGARTCWGPGG